MATNHVDLAIEQLRKGRFIVLYDGDEREGEADLIVNANFIDPKKITLLRRDAGGLICLALGKELSGILGLKFISDIISSEGTFNQMAINKTAYGDKPAFSIAINHKEVFTGIPDNDRALTIKKVAGLSCKAPDAMRNEFLNNFYTPGHVFLLIDRGLNNRRGHTELSIELAKLAGMPETMVLCEMLDSGKALSKNKAIKYAKRHKLVFIEGKEIGVKQ